MVSVTMNRTVGQTPPNFTIHPVVSKKKIKMYIFKDRHQVMAIAHNTNR
jgi:hypothetical protein